MVLKFKKSMLSIPTILLTQFRHWNLNNSFPKPSRNVSSIHNRCWWCLNTRWFAWYTFVLRSPTLPEKLQMLLRIYCRFLCKTASYLVEWQKYSFLQSFCTNRVQVKKPLKLFGFQNLWLIVFHLLRMKKENLLNPEKISLCPPCPLMQFAWALCPFGGFPISLRKCSLKKEQEEDIS